MAAVTGSGTETIHVRLMDEGVDVWRPAVAVALDANIYQLAEQSIPEDEVWEFGPGETVITRRHGTGPDAFVAAVGRPADQAIRRTAV